MDQLTLADLVYLHRVYCGGMRGISEQSRAVEMLLEMKLREAASGTVTVRSVATDEASA